MVVVMVMMVMVVLMIFPQIVVLFPSSSFSSSLFLFKRSYLFILRERGREGERVGEREGEIERERNINVREKLRSVPSPMCPDWGLNLQPRYMP